MTTAHQIDQAIGAHGLWKSRLRTAIETGVLEGDVAALRATDRCAFGQWMHGPHISTKQKVSSHWFTVARLHTRFHEAAAEVAELALAGRREEAKALMERHGAFGVASSELVGAMLRWKQSIDAQASVAVRPQPHGP